MRRHVLVPAVCLLTASCLSVAACGSGGTTTSSASPAPTVSAEAPVPVTQTAPATTQASDATGAPLSPDEAGENSDGQEWTGEPTAQDATADSALVITGLRTGVHEGYDRVVVEFSGEGMPGWDAAWADEAWTQGKGDPISVEGDHTLVLRGTGVTMPVMPDQQEIAYTGPWSLAVGGAGIGIGSVYLDGAFEDQFQLVVGTGVTSYRVFTLTDPTRLVVDVKHPE